MLAANMVGKMRITILSIACCLPTAATWDQEYIEKIGKVLEKTGIDATVEKISGLNAAFGVANVDLSKLVPLYDKYGTAVAPVLFINGDLVLYGGVPSLEKLTEVIKAANKPAG